MERFIVITSKGNYAYDTETPGMCFTTMKFCKPKPSDCSHPEAISIIFSEDYILNLSVEPEYLN